MTAQSTTGSRPSPAVTAAAPARCGEPWSHARRQFSEDARSTRKSYSLHMSKQQDEVLGLQYEYITGVVRWTRETFAMYDHLFGSETVIRTGPVMERASRTFFRLVRAHFLGGVVLGVCKLADPQSDRSNKNASFQSLLTRLKSSPESYDSRGLQRLYEEFTASIRSSKRSEDENEPPAILDVRRKVIAHLDEGVPLDASMQDISMDDLHTAVSAMTYLWRGITQVKDGVDLAPFDPISDDDRILEHRSSGAVIRLLRVLESAALDP